MNNPWSNTVPPTPTRLGAAEYFTGHVNLSELLQSPSPMNLFVARVHFSPQARTHWHTHPKGQILVVESGVGWFQRWGETVIEIRAGDTVYIPPQEKHWHGASQSFAMSHLAMQAIQDGVHTVWLEPVNSEQYRLG